MGQDLAKNSKVFDETAMNSVDTAVFSRQETTTLKDSEQQYLTQVFHKLAALSPKDNYIDKDTFEHYFPLGGILGGRLFASFDKNKNGVIDLQEFLDGMVTCLEGSRDDKYQIAFEMFNLDGSEGISTSELYIVLKSVLQSTSRQANGGYSLSYTGSIPRDESELDNAVRSIVQEVYSERKTDLDKDNKLTVGVFKSWMESHPSMLDSIFGQACLKDKRAQYIRLDEEPRRAPGKSLAEVRKQTWVKSDDIHHSPAESAPAFSGSYKSAEYLWSPVFPQTSSKPCSRGKLAACLLYDSLYMYGGRGTCSTLKDLWRYDIGENTWSPVPSDEECRPPSLQEHTMSVYKGKLVLFGGEFTSSIETPLWTFDVGSGTWSRPKSTQKGPVNRKSHSAVVCGDCLFIFGGYIDLRGATEQLWKFDFVSSTWTRERSKSRDWPSPRYAHSAAVFDKSMVILGGLEEQQYKNDLWLWNIAAKKWTRIKARGSPPPLIGHTAVKVGDGMLVFGGESTGGTLHNDLWRFDFESRSWSKISTLGMISPPARSHHSIVPIPDLLISTLRPTSSHSAPPCTPAIDREHACAENHLIRKSTSKIPLGKIEVSASSVEGNRASPTQSTSSLGSLNSSVLLVNIESDDRPSTLNSCSLDSLVTKTDPPKNENMSMVNQGGDFSPSTSMDQEQLDRQLNSNNKSTDIMDCYSTGGLGSLHESTVKTRSDSSLNTLNCATLDTSTRLDDRSSYPKCTGSSTTKSNTSVYTRDNAQSYLPPPQKLLKPVSADALSTGPYSHLPPRLYPPQIKNTGIVYLMLLGGMSKRTENYGKSIDMWRCEIDPVKRKSKTVHQIVVQSTQPTHAQPTRRVVSGEYSRLKVADDSDDSEDDDDVDDAVDECVLLDVSDSDNTSMDLPLINGEIRTGTAPVTNALSRVSV